VDPDPAFQRSLDTDHEVIESGSTKSLNLDPYTQQTFLLEIEEKKMYTKKYSFYFIFLPLDPDPMRIQIHKQDSNLTTFFVRMSI
jgi:hypothetical protein